MPAEKLGDAFVAATFPEEEARRGDVRHHVSSQRIGPTLQVRLEAHRRAAVLLIRLRRDLIGQEHRHVVLLRQLLHAITRTAEENNQSATMRRAFNLRNELMINDEEEYRERNCASFC